MATGVSVSQLTELLHETWGEHGPWDQINNAIDSYKHFKQKSDTDKWEGEVYVESLHSGRNRGVKAVAERGQIRPLRRAAREPEVA